MCVPVLPPGREMVTVVSPQPMGRGVGADFSGDGCIQDQWISLLTRESHSCYNVGASLWVTPGPFCCLPFGEKGSRDGLGGQTECLRKPGGLQTAAQAPRLRAGPGCASPAGPSQLGVAALDSASLMDGGLPPVAALELASPAATGPGSHRRDPSSSRQLGQPMQQHTEASGPPGPLLCARAPVLAD